MNSESAQPERKKRRRIWFPRFTIRILLILMVIVATALALGTREMQRLDRESNAIQQLGEYGTVDVYRAPVLDESGLWYVEGPLNKSAWMRFVGGIIGENAFYPVLRLEVGKDYSKDGDERKDLNDPEFKKLISQFTLLESLRIGSCPFRNLDFLKGLTRLENLNLYQSEELVDIKGLAELPRLKELCLGYGCKNLNDFVVFNSLPELQLLEIKDCPSIESMRVFAVLTKLKKLNLAGCNLQRLDGVENFAELEDLDLTGCTKLKNIEGVEQLSKLKNVQFKGCDLVDLTPLSNLHSLRAVGVQGNLRLADLMPIGGMSELVFLNLADCESLESLDGLQGMKQLDDLVLTNCKSLVDVSAIHGLTQISNIAINGCRKLSRKERGILKARLPKANLRTSGFL
ncbi:MAG: leucine-rich repeat domain-containing protein [Mariniblastus sp.]